MGSVMLQWGKKEKKVTTGKKKKKNEKKLGYSWGSAVQKGQMEDGLPGS